MKADNAADGSIVDANANVTQKTIATLEAELYKPNMIRVNRARVCKKLQEMFNDADLAEQYIEDIESHLIYVHDETSLKPYCASITLYPFLLEGTKCIGGVSKAPTNLQAFCGGFVNFVYQTASNFAGAIATVEFLMYFDYFAYKTYGENYLTTHTAEVMQELQGVVYALNQPASARGDQSVFWNISIFDKYFAREMFGEFYFPDGSRPNLKRLRHLQIFFLDWFTQERKRELLTFPVVTASILTENEIPKDKEFVDTLADRMSQGSSFFVYMSDSVDSLASCCRLRNELADNTFSYTLGAGGVVTGSTQVITININRMKQKAVVLADIVQRVQLYLLAHKALIKDMINAGLLPVYKAGVMDLDKQFLTIGLNGVLEGYEALCGIGYNGQYEDYLINLFSEINQCNKAALKKYNVRFNTELVPAENLGVKNAKWDKADELKVSRDVYNSYFYAVEDTSSTILDKIHLYRREITKHLDGGSALHLNLEQLPSKQQAKMLFALCAINGVPYWTTNTKCTICNSCGFINPETTSCCTKCNAATVEYGTRIIGYLKRISNFSKERQREHAGRYYEKETTSLC